MKDKYEMAVGKAKKAVAIRLEPGSDLLTGLGNALAESGIKNGAIVTGIGSLSEAEFCNVLLLDDDSGKYGYSEPIHKEGPIELLAMSGVICHDNDGEVNLHIHVIMSYEEGEAFGGHLCEGTKVLLTTDVIIEELGEGIDMVREFDETLGIMLFKPVQV